MRRKVIAFIVLFTGISVFSYAQGNKKTAIVKGILINALTKSPFSDLKISIPSLNVFTTSDGNGNFNISEVAYGNYSLVINGNNAKRDTIAISVNTDVLDLHEISITPAEPGGAQDNLEIPTITLSEEDNYSTSDDGVSVQNAGGIAVSSRDPFINSMYLFNLFYHVQPRGSHRNTQEFEVNGVPMNDVETGNASWSIVGGLSDVFHGRDVKYGLAPSDYTFGGLLGSTYFASTAADQWKELKVSYSLRSSNNNKVMVTYNSGLLKNGWAFSGSFVKHWEERGYIPGTFYDGYSYYGAVSKTIGKGSLNLTTFGSPTRRGKAAAATKEAFDLAGTNYYNHNWGYMPDGSIRNAQVQNVFQPKTILNYEYKPTDKTRWNTAVAYESGKDKNSNAYGYNYDPAVVGDYYKNLPSYYLTFVPPDSNTASVLRGKLKSDPNLMQLNWSRMYQDNYLNTQTMHNVNGIAGNNFTGKQSIYTIADKVNALNKFTFSTNIEHALNENITIYGGFTSISQTTESYLQMVDLLGGDFFVNFNQFASQQYIGNSNYNQNNLNNPNQLIRKGDKFGYDYTIHFNNNLGWAQSVFTYDMFDFFISVYAGDNSFYRDGAMRNGLFPNNSFGKSAVHSFFDYGIKGGASYKIDSRNFLFLNAAYTTTPPTSDNTYISAQTRDFTVANPSVQNNQSLEGGYMLKSSNLSARIVGYVTDVKNATEIKRFYNDDPAFYTFVNYVMSGENTRSVGTEIALDYKLTRELNVTGIANVGQAFYTNRPNINVYLDNDTLQNAKPDKAYINNYYLAVGPQTSYMLGFNYRPKLTRFNNLKSTFINLNLNYFDKNYVEVNPNRRTATASGLYPEGSAQWHQVFDQEVLPSVFTADIRFGTNIQLAKMSNAINRLSHYTSLNISAGINNLFNNTNVINSGFEQLRYDFVHYDPAKFPTKYIYGMGINFSVNISLRF